MFSEKELEEVKEKLFSHIETTFPEEQIGPAISQVNSMNSEQLEEFLEKNQLIKKDEQTDCVFCLISEGKINSVKIDENEGAIAILEINPVSKGHTLVIPKTHRDAEEKEMFLAKNLSKKLKEKFSPREIKIVKSRIFGHEIINVIPIYKEENINSERKSMRIEELEEIKQELKKEIPKEETPKVIEKIEEFLWLPKRIP
jgi:histidine triad (HIT) family protein